MHQELVKLNFFQRMEISRNKWIYKIYNIKVGTYNFKTLKIY